ncbi:MAG: hypothetical protein WCS33_00200 [Candidatus Caldatribacteriota bacterium]
MLAPQVILDIHNSSNKRSDGSSRFVYPISDTVVMKLPISFEYSGGIEQSNEELLFYQNRLQPQFSHLVANLIDYVLIPLHPFIKSPWCEYNTVPILFLERVEPLHEFITADIGLFNLIDILKTWYGKQLGNKYYQELLHFSRETGLSDVMSNITNWGVNAAGDIICIDCGILHKPGSFDSRYIPSHYYSSSCSPFFP